MGIDAWAGVLVIGRGLAVFDGPGASAARHQHDAVQVVACAARPVTVVFDQVEVKEHVIVVPSRMPHRVEGTGARVIVALVEPAVFGFGPIQPEVTDPVAYDVEFLATLMSSTSADAATVLARGVRLIEAVGGRPPADPSVRLRSEVARVIELVEEQIDATADVVPNLRDIAAQVALSPSRLSPVFADEVGFPFRRYVLWVRLRSAALAVLDGADMTTAAASAGFSDSAHFSRVFRSTFGLTPSEVLPILDIAELRG